MNKLALVEKSLSELEIRRQKIENKLFDDVIDNETYKRRIEALEQEIEFKKIAIAELSIEIKDVSECMEFCELYLGNLVKPWMHEGIEFRQRFQTIIYPNGIRLKNAEFVGTDKTASLFTLFAPNQTDKSHLVPPAEFESRTVRLPGARHAPTAAKPAKRLTDRSSGGKPRGFPAEATLS